MKEDHFKEDPLKKIPSEIVIPPSTIKKKTNSETVLHPVKDQKKDHIIKNDVKKEPLSK